jgi:hypothetical protein
MNSRTLLPSWKKLVSHSETIAKHHMKKLFAINEERLK